MMVVKRESFNGWLKDFYIYNRDGIEIYKEDKLIIQDLPASSVFAKVNLDFPLKNEKHDLFFITTFSAVIEHKRNFRP